MSNTTTMDSMAAQGAGVQEEEQPARPISAKATQAVAEEIQGALQDRIAGWQAERAKLEGRVKAQERLQERYDLLGELIAEAQAESSRLMARAESAGQTP